MTKERVLLRPTARDPTIIGRLIGTGRELGYTGFVVPPGVAIRPRRGEQWHRIDRRGIRPASHTGDLAALPILSVGSSRELDRALAVGAERGGLALRWIGDRMIPLETALLRSQRRFQVWVMLRRPAEVPGALGALERGADRVVFEFASEASLHELDNHVGSPGTAALRWTWSVVDRVEPAGTSERVIVDTTSLLTPTEGLLLGSSAAILFHVASEATGSAFTRPRPFRVNAGSPHLYVLMADGSTRYLSELEPGDVVRIVSPQGQGRPVRVGRLKIERRPMTMVRARWRHARATIFVQEAETVRLSANQGPVGATALRPGSKLWTVRLPAARHLGVPVDETIEER